MVTISGLCQSRINFSHIPINVHLVIRSNHGGSYHVSGVIIAPRRRTKSVPGVSLFPAPLQVHPPWFLP